MRLEFNLYVVTNDIRSSTDCQDISFQAGGRVRWSGKILQWFLKRFINRFIFFIMSFQKSSRPSAITWVNHKFRKSMLNTLYFLLLNKVKTYFNVCKYSLFFRNSFNIYFMNPYLVFKFFPLLLKRHLSIKETYGTEKFSWKCWRNKLFLYFNVRYWTVFFLSGMKINTLLNVWTVGMSAD